MTEIETIQEIIKIAMEEVKGIWPEASVAITVVLNEQVIGGLELHRKDQIGVIYHLGKMITDILGKRKEV